MADINIRYSYPKDPDYDYETKLTRLNLDEERKKDITTGRGFVVSPTNGIKKDLKDPDSIFSPKFGQTLKDMNPFADRYKCECGYTTQRINNGCLCKVCNTRVKYVDDDFEYFGWIVLQDHWYIHPGFYSSLEYLIGKEFHDIIKPIRLVDEDGNEKPAIVENQPFYGIGIPKFRERFLEIIEYYYGKSKNKVDYYEILRDEHEKVFTQSVPTFTTLLRPFEVDKFTFSHEKSNAYYTAINKLVTDLNNTNRLDMKRRQRKPADQLLYDLQMKVKQLFDQIVEIISGKKGSIRQLFGGRYNFSSRNVIKANPKLRIDEITLPYSALVELLKQSIINILKKTYDMSINDATSFVYNAMLEPNKTITDIINTIIRDGDPSGRGIPVIINRGMIAACSGNAA